MDDTFDFVYFCFVKDGVLCLLLSFNACISSEAIADSFTFASSVVLAFSTFTSPNIPSSSYHHSSSSSSSFNSNETLVLRRLIRYLLSYTRLLLSLFACWEISCDYSDGVTVTTIADRLEEKMMKEEEEERKKEEEEGKGDKKKASNKEKEGGKKKSTAKDAG